MGAPLDAFTAGQYYGFYKAPLLADSNVNFPDYSLLAASNPALFTPGALGNNFLWIGATKRGFTIASSVSAELIEGDIWGGSVVDMVYRGGNMFMSYESLAFRPGTLIPYWPWQTLGAMGTIGRLGSMTGGTLILVAAPFTPAAGIPDVGQVVINTLTAANAIVAEQIQSEIVFDSRLRSLPVKLRLLPFYDGILGTPTGKEAITATAGLRSNQNNVFGAVAAGTVGSSTKYLPTYVGNYKWYSLL